MSTGPGRIIVIRHGQTVWSREGRHTGLTDIALTSAGEEQARGLRAVLAGYDIALCLASPLQRAWSTAQLAGLCPVSEPGLLERSYGTVEGLSTEQVREQTGNSSWDVWDDDLKAGPDVTPAPDAYHGPGEDLAAVAARVEPLLTRGADLLREGRDVALVSHSHLLRILTACWLDLGPGAGRHLVLDAAHLGVLGRERATPALLGWNLSG